MFLTLCLDDSRAEITRRFYERLGLEFAPEQHGSKGLHHVAAAVDSVPVEIYPSIKGLPANEGLFIGFMVDAPAAVMQELIEQFGGKEVDPPIPVTRSGIATLRDPNGVLVRLFPQKDESVTDGARPA
jgi:hypothetical protein